MAMERGKGRANIKPAFRFFGYLNIKKVKSGAVTDGAIRHCAAGQSLLSIGAAP
jgi:hypothetical protein